jgi:hypothetical protein
MQGAVAQLRQNLLALGRSGGGTPARHARGGQRFGCGCLRDVAGVHVERELRDQHDHEQQ